MALLQVKKISKSFQQKPIVSELSFEINAGEVVGLLGPNGAGKTTAFYLTSGLIRPDSGEVYLNGKEITKLPMDKRALLGMGYLSQEPSVFKSLTVKENILAILEIFVPNRKTRKQKLIEALDELHLTKIQDKKASLLSGGERRRLEITRVLLSKPSLLLLDEPFANIDPLAIQEVKDLISLLAKRGIAVLVTDHNAREIFSIIDRGYLMQEGRLLLSGTVEELLASPLAKSAYLGNEFSL